MQVINDKLYPVSIQHLVRWMLAELKTDQLFGIPKALFFEPKPTDSFRLMRYGQQLETPIGVAAGPHTQLSHNIIAAWLCGARYMELKTVQTLDELEVSKPCIDMQDEGYNCEWSQELKLKQSLDEYLNAWIAIHILRHHFAWDSDAGPGVIFNMSVGYDLAGIMKPNVQEFMDRMEDSRELLDQKLESLTTIYPAVKDLKIPERMTDNITLSTMHGCPSDEIESIASYLIIKRSLHTAVKLNPTLLGPDQLRQILNSDLGYDSVHVPDEAFHHDLKYPEAVKLIRNLQTDAQISGVEFGLKLTNTLEVQNHRPIFPEQESMMYLSGRALHPLSINLAAKLQHEFNGELDISFSAGADAFNVADTLACNLRPITTCTDVLKPGGYTRLAQYLDAITGKMQDVGAEDIDNFILKYNYSKDDVTLAGMKNLEQYAHRVIDNQRYHKHNHHFDSIKTERKLNTFDCISAPCLDSCATGQNIPEYLRQTALGNFDKAFETIQETNPLPGITGHVCDHLCQLKCTRNNYDSPVLIREIKRFITDREIKKRRSKPSTSQECKVAVIGAGPAGLSCAYFLGKAGVKVELFESKAFPGGMVSDAIPEFRLTEDVINLDMAALKKLGVRFNYGQQIDKDLFKELRRNNDAVFIGVGAQESLTLGIVGEELAGVLDPLHFLSEVRQGDRPDLGTKVAIIGGGNTAMDAARTALRLSGGTCEVCILYRRTKAEMPADIDEIEAALAEGITIHELVAPLSFSGEKSVGLVVCQKMKLGEPDASGRRRPIPLDGETLDLQVDTIIPAIGQKLVLDFISAEDFQVNSVTGETQIANVYAGGDAVRGASSVINAVGDGQRAAQQILKNLDISLSKPMDERQETSSILELKKKAAHREYGIHPPLASSELSPEFPMVHRTLTEQEALTEASRCLLCDDYCSVCVGVCPNLANLTYTVVATEYPVQEYSAAQGNVEQVEAGSLKISQEPQVLNIGDFCNECGNCTTFCPTSGDPFKDKPRLHISAASYNESASGYHLDGTTLRFKSADYQAVLTFHNGDYLYHSPNAQVRFDADTKSIDSLNLEPEAKYFSTLEALEMIVLYEGLCDNPILK